MNKNINEILNPPDMQDEFTALMRTPDFAFVGAKKLPDGCYVGVFRLITTLAICIGVTRGSAYTRRYCFQDIDKCLSEYERIDTRDFVPEGWVARRPDQPGDNSYSGPGSFEW